MSEGLPLPAQALTSVRMRMAAFLSRSSLLCRLGSSCLVTALICLQRFCTMALGRGEEGRGRVQRADVFRDPPPPTSGPAGAACGRAPVAVSVRRPSAPLAAPWLPGWAGRVGGRGAGPWAPPAGMELVADARIHGLPGAVRATRRRAPPSTPEDVCTRVSSWAVLTGGGPWRSPWSISPDSWTGGGLGQALSPALAPLLPGEETHALRVGVDGGEELPGALQLQVREVLPMPRGGQQAFQRFQGRAVGGQGGHRASPDPGEGACCPGWKGMFSAMAAPFYTLTHGGCFFRWPSSRERGSLV